MVNILAHQNIDDAVTSRGKAFLISTPRQKRNSLTVVDLCGPKYGSWGDDVSQQTSYSSQFAKSAQFAFKFF